MYLYGNSEKYLTDKNLNIGVRNYVLDSEKSVSMTGTGENNQTLIINSLSKPLKQFTSEELSHVILSFNWSVSDGASGSVEIQFNDTPWDLDCQILKIDFSNAKSGRFCKKFNLATKKYYGGSINATGLAIKQSGFNGTFTADHIKLEIGDVPSQWCPAPEDYVMKSDYMQTILKCVPHVNLLQNSAGPFFTQAGPKRDFQQTDVNAINQWQVFTNSTVTLTKGETYTVSAMTNGVFSNNHDPSTASNKCVIWIGPPINMVISGENTSANTFTWNSDTGTYPFRVNRYGKDSQVKCWNVKIEHGSQATDWTPCPLDS